MKSLALFFISWGLLACAHAQSGLVRGGDLQSVTLQEALQDVKPGSIVVIGENHGLKTHQQEQMQVMQALRNRGFVVAVGLEFLNYTDQNWVTLYRQGQLPEAEFLQKIKWGGTPFEFYRDQALFPNLSEGAETIALNAPSFITRKISQKGLGSLTAEELQILPPFFTVGNAHYRERFFAAMGGHLPNPTAAENYFTAQSAWDDTMAWQATHYMNKNPQQVLVIVVGEFHTQYGGGLPDRLRARGNHPVVTFSQVNTSGLAPEEIQQNIQPSPVYGPRADFLLIGEAQ